MNRLSSQFPSGVRRIAACVVMIASAGPAGGGTAMAQPTQPDRPALSGPTVSETATKKTLVEFDFPGRVRRLEAAPEEIAVGLLELDAMVREQVDAIFTRRVRKLDEFVGQNLDLLTKLETASATGDKMDKAKLIAEAVHKLSPVWLKGSLRSQIEKVLPEAQRAEFARLVDEYWNAIVKEQQAGAPSATAGAEPSKAEKGAKKDATTVAKKKGRFEIVTAERLASFGKEIERAFQRQLTSGDIIYQYIASYITLTDEQKGRIRELCADFAERTKMSPTEKQNQELFVKIAGTLDVKQQTELANLIKGLKKPKSASKP